MPEYPSVASLFRTKSADTFQRFVSTRGPLDFAEKPPSYSARIPLEKDHSFNTVAANCQLNRWATEVVRLLKFTSRQTCPAIVPIHAYSIHIFIHLLIVRYIFFRSIMLNKAKGVCLLAALLPVSACLNFAALPLSTVQGGIVPAMLGLPHISDCQGEVWQRPSDPLNFSGLGGEGDTRRVYWRSNLVSRQTSIRTG